MLSPLLVGKYKGKSDSRLPCKSWTTWGAWSCCEERAIAFLIADWRGVRRMRWGMCLYMLFDASMVSCLDEDWSLRLMVKGGSQCLSRTETHLVDAYFCILDWRTINWFTIVDYPALPLLKIRNPPGLANDVELLKRQLNVEIWAMNYQSVAATYSEALLSECTPRIPYDCFFQIKEFLMLR